MCVFGHWEMILRRWRSEILGVKTSIYEWGWCTIQLITGTEVHDVICEGQLLTCKWWLQCGLGNLRVCRCLWAVSNLKVPQRSDNVKIIFLHSSAAFNTLITLLLEILSSLSGMSLSWFFLHFTGSFFSLCAVPCHLPDNQIVGCPLALCWGKSPICPSGSHSTPSLFASPTSSVPWVVDLCRLHHRLQGTHNCQQTIRS